MGTPNKVTPQIEAELTRRWRAGESQTEIAKALQLNRLTVTTHLRRLLGVATPAWRGAGRIAIQRPRVPQLASSFIPPDNPPRLLVPYEYMPGEAARFWAKVSAPNEHGCRFWLASFTGDHGQFGTRRDGRRVTEVAYRVAWRLTYGPLRVGFNANHRCDVRACVEPTHLWAGSQADNMKDMAAKGRSRRGRHDGQKGEANVTAKLTWARVSEMRQLRETRGLTIKQLAVRFGVSAGQASNICAYRQWVEDAAEDTTT